MNEWIDITEEEEIEEKAKQKIVLRQRKDGRKEMPPAHVEQKIDFNYSHAISSKL